jgi:putative heme-binding domain-containing protein
MNHFLHFFFPACVAFIAATAAAQTPAGEATPADQIKVADGFKIELLKSATKEEGSWVCMAVDPKGRLYISPQGKPPGAGMKKEDTWGGLWRATLADPSINKSTSQPIEKWEKVAVPVGDAMGMLWAFDSLYVSGDGPEGRGIYRLKDTNGDGDLDAWTLFKKVPGGNGEHGAHALVLGPDGKSIYIVHGNSTPLIEGTDPQSPYRNYAEDDLLPRLMDPVATFFDKIKSPYGHVLKTDENGEKWELFAGGFRNPYDIDFNADGELFTYDSDMEWDVGSPWYRPTRVLHVVPGGEYGFREGTAKWPAWYPDSLPAAVNIGLGSPTGVKFGTRSNFPARYKGAFFIMDWTFGRILAVHLQPKGATYTAENPLPSPYHLIGPASSPDVEEFTRGKGLPVTDLEFGKDGAMYFTIGGRGTQAGLYRVSYVGSEEKQETKPPSTAESEAARARDFRKALEGIYDGLPDRLNFSRRRESVRAVETNDRFIYFAARQQAEEMPLERLRQLAFEEPNIVEAAPEGLLFGPIRQAEVKDAKNARALDGLMGLLALARVGTKDDQEAILKALGKFPLDTLSDELKLDKLRVIEVALARHGRPSAELVQIGIEKLSRQYPAKTFALNRELVQLLVYLGAPDAVEKTLALMDQTTEPAEQVWYALCLREATGWTPAQREKYFGWFAKAASYRGGNSFKKFILRIRDLALEKVPQEQRPALLAIAEKTAAPATAAPAAPARPFVKAWTVADLVPALDGVSKGRDFARGKRLYKEAMCAQCHLFAGEGGGVGPDLTAVSGRFSRKDILEAIIEPSKALSEQYASFLFTMKDGSTIGGQIAEENHYLLTLIVDPLTGAKQNYPKGNVVKREMSPVSLMPPALLFTLSQDEVLDLLAYLECGGNEKAPMFAKP